MDFFTIVFIIFWIIWIPAYWFVKTNCKTVKIK